MGGHQVPGLGSGDSFDEEGYDESQRAEILEATVGGPSNGTLLTDLDPDLGADVDADDEEDELLMVADEVGDEEVGDPDEDEAEIEDSLQVEFEDGDIDDDDLDDPESTALNP